MYETYIKSLRMIEKYKITNKKQYAKFVKEYNLLSAVSLEYISGKNFSDILKTISKKIA